MKTTLYYVHDPMCSWCYGFAPALSGLLAGLPADIGVRRLLGGLAPDSAEPMPEEMRQGLQQTWRRVEESIPGTRFNFAFWTACKPRRSTYPACRAVLAARAQDPGLDAAMISAIQRAYYREARNPSDNDTLIALFDEITSDRADTDTDAFAATLDAPETQKQLEREISESRALGADSFPSLVLEQDGSRWRVPVDYRDPGPMLAVIAMLR